MSALAQHATEHFIWSVEGKPISIHLNLDVVERLKPVESQTNGRTVETGGILFGYARQLGDVYLVSVEDFEPIECEHLRSESWALSSRDRRLLESRLRRLTKRHEDKPQVVGWFRTHTRPGLYLDQQDYRLFRDYFSDPAAIALVIRPATPVPAAGFFFWENGDIQRSRTYKSFPFLPDALRANPGRVQVLVPRDAVAAKPAQPAASTARPHKPAISAARPVAARVGLLAAFNWRHAILVFPVLAGIGFGLFWNPKPLKRVERVKISEVGAPQEEDRAVFAPPPVPDDQSSVYTPPPEDIVENRGRTATVKPKPARTLVVPRPVPQVREPVMSIPGQPPAVAANARYEGLPPSHSPALPRAVATVEPAKVSAIRRAVGSIPGLGFLKRKKQASGEDYVPARVVSEYRPLSPAALSEEVLVNVRLTVSPTGQVDRAELLSKRVDSGIAATALDAARRWRFEPAMVDEKPVPSEMIIRFRFGSGDRNGS